MATGLALFALLSCSADADTTELFHLRLGTNTAGDVFGDTWTALSDGDQLSVVLGPQLSWMVVVAARIENLPQDLQRVSFVCTVTDSTGNMLGEVHSVQRPVVPAPDDEHYLLNIFVVVPSRLSKSSEPGHVALTVQTDGFEGSVSAAVDLVGGER
ncbi:MAG: hypothetical protein ACI9OJ_001606 [Myxococcota bacterium]|jgi:hypothetical protein